MNIKQTKEEIKNTVKAYLNKNEYGEYKIPSLQQRPLLLIGPPGIGKTQIMEQIARECQIGLVSYTITHHTRQSAVGLPFIKEERFEDKTYSITEYTMSEIIASVYRKMKETGLKEGILFIDEINCVSETLAPTMLQFLQCKTFGNQSVPKGWIIVAAGNPPEYNKSVRDFDMVTLDRIRYINVEADYRIWKEYALEKNVHRSILSYLELKPNSFYKVETDVDGMHFVTARGWDDLGYLIKIYESLKIPVTQSVIEEFIHHDEVAEDFMAYYELYKKYEDDYEIYNVLEGRVSTNIYARVFEASFDERVSVVNLLLDGISVKLNRYIKEKEKTDIWYGFLKEYRQCIKTTDDYKKEYNNVLMAKIDSFNLLKKEGILVSEQIHLHEELINQWKSVEIGDGSDREAFECAYKPFKTQKEKLEESTNNILKSLNYSFKFMEDAFTSGQEMVIFIMGLSMDSKIALFLSENDIPLYNKYKKELLIGTRKAEILDDLQH